MNTFSGICLLTIVSLSAGTNVEELSCTNAAVQELRISGCDQQPCTIRKGERLPFELQFVYETPGSPAKMKYSVFVLHYSSRPDTFYSWFAQGDCNGGLGFECPLNAGTVYTVKSELYVDPKATCTVGCGPNDGTGLKKTHWDFSVTAPNEKTSKCSFEVTLDIVK